MPELHTWGRTHQATAAAVVAPLEEAEVVEAVVRARARGGRVRPFGALHSWSDCALDRDVALTLDGLQGVVAVEGDRVRVHGGTRLHALNAELEAEGLALPVLGSIDHQSIAGAVSTGTHGSAVGLGNLASLVRGMRLVTGTGEVLDLDAHDPRLDGLRVALGAGGVITELTLDVVPAFRLREVATPMPIDDAVADLDAIARSAPFVKVWWLPHTGTAIVFRAEPTREPSTFSRTGRWLDERVVNQVAFRGILGLGGRFAGLVPTLNRLVGQAYFQERVRVGRSHEVFHLAMPPVHREMEYAVPMARAAEALGAQVELVRREGLRVNFIAEARFVAADDGWISPAHGQAVCQLGAYIGHGHDVARYYAGFEAAMLALGGRPHWGKEWFADPAVVRSRYPRMGDWAALVAELDPDRVFRGPYVERLLSATGR